MDPAALPRAAVISTPILPAANKVAAVASTVFELTSWAKLMAERPGLTEVLFCC